MALKSRIPSAGPQIWTKSSRDIFNKSAPGQVGKWGHPLCGTQRKGSIPKHLQTLHQGSGSGGREELASPSVGSRHSTEREAAKSQATSGHRPGDVRSETTGIQKTQHNAQAFTEAYACPLLPRYFLLVYNVRAYL